MVNYLTFRKLEKKLELEISEINTVLNQLKS